MPDGAVIDQADAGGPPVTRETSIARPVTRARQLAGLRLFRCRLTIGQPRLPDEAETRGQSSGAGDLDSSGEVSIRWKKPDPLLDRGFDLLAAVQQRECLAGTPLIEQIGIVSALRISRLAGAVHGQ